MSNPDELRKLKDAVIERKKQVEDRKRWVVEAVKESGGKATEEVLSRNASLIGAYERLEEAFGNYVKVLDPAATFV